MFQPSPKFRDRVARGLIWVAQKLGSKLRDREGNVICRAFIASWGGNLHLIGIPRNIQLRPVPLLGKRLSYWRQSAGWEHAAPPDFPRIGRAVPSYAESEVCHVVICHLPPDQTARIYKEWQTADPEASILIAYGGTRENFSRLSPALTATYVADPGLRTVDHTRERQQYAGVFRAAMEWLPEHAPEVTHIHLVEYDVVPVVPGTGLRLVSALEAENADIAGFGLVDISGCIHPHNAHELGNERFIRYLESESVRENKTRIISMLGCSTIWTKAAFTAIAQSACPRAYLEVGMPTIAHHYGFRVRPLDAAQERFVSFQGDFTDRIEEYRREGAWLVHPCKLWHQRESPVMAGTSQDSSSIG